jgi:hypothetical protein
MRRAFEATGACIVLPHASFDAADTLAGHLLSALFRVRRNALPRWRERLTPPAAPTLLPGWPDVVAEFVSPSPFACSLREFAA